MFYLLSFLFFMSSSVKTQVLKLNKTKLTSVCLKNETSDCSYIFLNSIYSWLNIVPLVLVGDFFISYLFAKSKTTNTLFSRITHTFTIVYPSKSSISPEQPFYANRLKVFVFVYASSFLCTFIGVTMCSGDKCVALKSSLISVKTIQTSTVENLLLFSHSLSVFIFNWIPPFYTSI